MKHSPYTLGIITGFCIAALYFMAPGIFESFKQPEASYETNRRVSL